MSAEIIPFPKSKKQLELEAMRDFVETAKIMITASIADDLKNYNGPNVAGVPVDEPKTRYDYLELCKQFLEPEDYEDVLCSIMDREHYLAMERPIRNVVDSYFSFPR
jgi:hypothetical protein